MGDRKFLTETESCFLTYYPKILVIISKEKSLNISRLANMTDITYSHLWKCVMKFAKWNLLTVKKRGREDRIEITPSGLKLAEKFENLFSTFEKMSLNALTEVEL
jgi:predicted transcriptional regulator